MALCLLMEQCSILKKKKAFKEVFAIVFSNRYLLSTNLLDILHETNDLRDFYCHDLRNIVIPNVNFFDVDNEH